MISGLTDCERGRIIRKCRSTINNLGKRWDYPPDASGPLTRRKHRTVGPGCDQPRHRPVVAFLPAAQIDRFSAEHLPGRFRDTRARRFSSRKNVCHRGLAQRLDRVRHFSAGHAYAAAVDHSAINFAFNTHSGDVADCLFSLKTARSILAERSPIRFFPESQSNQQRSWNLWDRDLRARLAALSGKSQVLVALVGESDPDLLGVDSELFARRHCSILFRRPRRPCLLVG